METIITIAVISILNIVCFFVGARIGQKVSNNMPIEIPNPMKAYKEYKAKEEQSKEQAKLNAMLENIDNYSGDSTGQKDIE